MSVLIRNAHQVRLVSDLPQSIHYYTNILGFTVDHWGHAVGKPKAKG